MDQYLQNLEIFYDEKMKFYQKDKYIKCQIVNKKNNLAKKKIN